MDDVIDIARKIKHKAYAKDFKGTVKQVVGTCVSIGCTIDGKKPQEVTALIDSNNYEINEWPISLILP